MDENNPLNESQEEIANQEPTEIVKGNNKKTLFIIGGVIAVLIIIGIAGFSTFASTPSGTMQTAYVTTMAEGLKGGPFDRATGFSETYKKAALGNSSQEGNIVLKDIPTDTSGSVNQFKNSGIYFDVKQDMKNKQVSASIGAMISKLRLFNLNIYGDEENLMFASPELYSGYLSVPLKNLGEAYNNSYIGQLEGNIFPEDYSIDLFQESPFDSDFYENLTSVFKKENLTLMNDFYDSITVEKADSKKITVGNSEKNCKGYFITMDGTKIKDIVKAYCEFLKQDSSFIDVVDSIAQSSSMSKTKIENDLVMILDSIAALNYTDIQFTCYVDNKNIIREFEHKSKIGYDGSDTIVDITANGTLLGEERAFDATELKIDLVEDNGDIFTILYTNNSKLDQSSGLITTDAKLSFDVDENLFYGTLNSSYDTKEGIYDMVFHLGDDNEEVISITSKGTIQIEKKGETFHIIADELNFNIDGDEILLSGEYKLEPLKEIINKPDELNVRYLFDMNESDLQELMSEIYSGIMGAILMQ